VVLMVGISVRSRAQGGRRGAGKKVAQRTRARPFAATWSACQGRRGGTGGVQGGAITGILRIRATPDPESLQNFYIRVF